MKFFCTLLLLFSVENNIINTMNYLEMAITIAIILLSIIDIFFIHSDDN